MEQSLKYIELIKYLQAFLFLVILAFMSGCGNDGSSASNEGVSKSVISLSPSSNSEYVLLGDNLNGVAGIDLTISYDNATLSSPTVTQGEFISGAMMAINKNTPGLIRIAIISTRAFSGNGQIATVSFASVTGPGNISISSVNMIDTRGATVP